MGTHIGRVVRRPGWGASQQSPQRMRIRPLRKAGPEGLAGRGAVSIQSVSVSREGAPDAASHERKPVHEEERCNITLQGWAGAQTHRALFQGLHLIFF